VILVKELWGDKNYGANYNVFDGGGSCVGTVVFAKYMVQAFYDAHKEPLDDDGYTCDGPRCFPYPVVVCCEASALAAALLLRADVLVENFAPRVLASLLLGGENDGRGSPEAVVARLAPRCVWLAMPGFASSDPTPRPEAWDGVVLAESGVLRDAGLNRPLRGVPVSYTSLPLPSARARRPDARNAVETRSKRRSTRRSSAPSARSSR